MTGDNDVDGRVFVETNVRYVDGIFDITPPHVVGGDLVDGELQDDRLTALILTEVVDGRATAPDFSLDDPVLECDVTTTPVTEPRP